MSVSLSAEQLAFFDRFARSPEGRFFLTVVKAWQADVDKTLRRGSGEGVLRAQGDAQRLEELEHLLDGGAAKRLDDLSKPARPTRRIVFHEPA